MTHFILEEIRHLLAQKIGIRIVSPSDCAVIALAIRKQLRKNISETTIKRLYGFAARQNQFSKFTINTVLEFIHEEGLPASTAAMASITSPSANEDWDYMLSKARMISENTMQQIVRSCTIPYECTVDRKFATHDFDYFYQSDFSFTVFVAQTGYGKSIMLSQLVQSQFLNTNGKYHDDAVLFLTANKLFKLEQDDQQLTADFQKMLGIAEETNLIAYFDTQFALKGKKLIIIIDEFAAILRQNGHKPKVFDRLLQLFDDIQDSPSIKVVLTMRCYVWRRFFEKIRHSHYLKKKWFTGSYFRLSEQSNMPAFTDCEVSIVLDRLKASPEVKENQDIKSLFRHPFYLAYYYMLQESYANSDYITHLISYEIMLRHMLTKIYHAKYAIEKVILCKKIIQFSNYGKNGDKIVKKHLIADADFHKNAYMELLLEGILIEEQRSENGFPFELVYFVQPHIFDYFLFKETLELHEMKMSKRYFEFLLENYKSDRQQLFALLKWSVFQIVKHSEFDLMKYVLNLELTSQEFNQLLLFLTKNIKHQIDIDPYTKILLSSSSLHEELIKKFIELDFFDPCYQQAISILIEITTNEQNLAAYYALLALFGSFTLDVKTIEHTIEKLKPIHFPTNWDVNPLEFSTFLLAKLTGKTSKKPSLFLKLGDGQLTIARAASSYGLPPLQQAVSWLYLLNFSWIFGTPTQSIHLITSINETYGLLQKRSLPLSRYLLHVLTLEVAKLGASKRSTQLVKMLSHMQNPRLYPSKGLWASEIYDLILVHHDVNNGEYHMALNRATRCISKFRSGKFIALEMMAHQLLVKIFTATNDIDRANEHRYLILNRLEDHQLDMQLFDCPMSKQVKLQ